MNVFRMCLLGVEVREVNLGSVMFKDVVNEVLRDWVSSYKDMYYLLGIVVGLYFYFMMVKIF